MDRTMSGRTTALCAAIQAVGGGLGWSVLPPLMPRIAHELGIAHAMGGLVWGAASLGIAIALPFGGAAVDRFGPRRVAGFALLAGAIACAARAWVVGPWSLAAAMLAFGAHIGFCAPAVPKALAGHASLGDVLRLTRNGRLMRVAAMQFLLFGGYLALFGMLPRTLVESEMTSKRVGFVVATWLAAAAVANYAGPWLSDRIKRRRPVLVAGSAVAGLALGAMALMPSAALPLLVVAALGGGCVALLLFAMPAEIDGVGAAHLGAALGLLTLVGQLGGFLLPTMAGSAAKAGGLTGAIGALALVHLAVLVPALGVRDTRTSPAPAAALAV